MQNAFIFGRGWEKRKKLSFRENFGIMNSRSRETFRVGKVINVQWHLVSRAKSQWDRRRAVLEFASSSLITVFTPSTKSTLQSHKRERKSPRDIQIAFPPPIFSHLLILPQQCLNCLLPESGVRLARANPTRSLLQNMFHCILFKEFNIKSMKKK